MADVSLSGYLPGEEKNGLSAFVGELTGVALPRPLYALVRIERKSRTVDDETGIVKAAVRITAIEVVPRGPDTKAMHSRLEELRGQRTGEQQLDIDALADEMGRSKPADDGKGKK